MNKQRFDIIASSLSSYMGVGFFTVDEQLDVDLGKTVKEFDDESLDRMALGTAMEDGCLNYFEKKLNIIIDERNSEYKYACNGMLKCKRDGRTFLNGIETGVENKYSNSKEVFTDDIGYIIQCQAYMMAWELDQWLLCGMSCGKPVYKIIKKDKDIQNDIETIVESVMSILTGIGSIEDYPWDIIEKYSKQKLPKVLVETEITDDEKLIFSRFGELNKEISILSKEKSELDDYIKSHYKDSMFVNDAYKYTITTTERTGGYDMDKLSIEHQDIDLEQYRKPSTSYSVIRVKELK